MFGCMSVFVDEYERDSVCMNMCVCVCLQQGNALKIETFLEIVSQSPTTHQSLAILVTCVWVDDPINVYFNSRVDLCASIRE